MNRLLQFLATNPWILIPVIVGIINFSVRVKQKAAEQKARRDAQNQISRQRADALRTGRPIEQASIAQNQPDTAEAQRKARIEALRQQRMQQLQAMREKRAAVPTASSPAPALRPTPTPTARPRPQAAPAARTARPAAQARRPVPGSGMPGHRAAAAPAQKALKTRMPRLKGAGQTPTSVPKSPSVTPVRRPRVAATDMRRSERSRKAVQRQQQPTPQGSLLQPVGAEIVPKTPSSLVSARVMLRGRAQARQAMIVREILGSPVSLQNPAAGPGALAN